MARRAIVLAAVILVGASSAAAAPKPKPKPSGTLVFYSQRTPNGGLYAESAAGGPLRLLQRGASWPGAIWSPDGKRYLFQREPDPSAGVQLWIADANGRHVRLLATKAPQESWSRDGRRIAFVRDATAIWTIGADGAGGREIVTAAGPNGFVADPTWSPDSRTIAFRGNEGGGSNDPALMAVGASGGAPRALASCVYFGPAWAPRGNRIAYVSCGPEGRTRNSPALYVQDVRSGARKRLVPDATGPIAWSPDGRWIALGVAGNGLQIVHPDGSGLRRLAKADYTSTPAWAPDSRRIAIAYGQPSDVVVVGFNGHAVRITQGGRYGYFNESPTWQPRDLPAIRLGGSVVSPAIPTDSIVRGRVLEAMRPVESLTADGSRVAIDYGGGRPAAAYPLIETWDAPGRQIVRFNAHGYQRPALAGTRVAVPQFSHAMGVNFYGIGLAATTHPNPVEADGLCRPGDGPIGGPCIRDPLGDTVGHGSLLVFDSWKGPEPYCLRPCPPPKHDGRLYRVDGNAAVQIATSPLELTPLAVDGNRILVDAGAGTLAVLDRTGRTRLTLPAPAATEAVLQGTDVVAHRGITLDDYDAATGALRHEWPIPADAVLEDVQSGVALFVDGSAIHFLRLADGRDAAIRSTGSGPLHSQLERAGLFYSYSVDDANRPGRVAFVPWPSLPLRP
jgi:Tol biopolymer transport system component